MRTQVWKWYCAFGVALALIYEVLSPSTSKLVAWPLVGWSSVIAIIVGVQWNRPRARSPWYLLAAGVATFIIGDNIYSFRNYVEHSDALFPSYVDVIYLSMYPLLIAGLVRMVHHRSGRDRTSVIDAGIVTSGIGLVVWVFVIAPLVRIEDLGVLERVASISYPLGDVALLAIAVRLAVGGGRRPVGFWLLTGSIVPLLVADALYGYLNLTGSWHEHNLIDVGWIAFYVGWGAAALHPSMRELTMPSASQRRTGSRRLVFVGSAVLVPPIVLFVQQAVGEVQDGAAIAIVGALSFVLVMVRIAGLAREVAEERSEARFRALIDNASDAIVVVGAGGDMRYHTPSTERVLGRGPEELDGRPLVDLLDRVDGEQLYLLLSGGAASTTVEWHVLRGDGESRVLEVIAADMRGITYVDGLVLTMRDVTERRSLDAELVRQALHDTLTDLPNRALFLDRVGHALSGARREQDRIGVIFLDLDDFKQVNDSLGHGRGDELLIAVASRLTAHAHPGDTVARFGGDEFALLVEEAEDVADMELVAHRVLVALAEPFQVEGRDAYLQASIGVAIGAPGTHDADDVLREADVAMYVAKRNGKARYEVFDPDMHEDARRRFEIAAELRGALARAELVVFYQPIVDIRSGHARGVEALVRWQHPERGLLLPDEFVPIAESNGLIVPLGQWVLGEACAQAQRWHHDGLTDDSFYVAVNLSGRHLQDPGVVGHVVDALRSSQLAAGSLVIEITETALIQDRAVAGSTLAELKRLGCRVAIDDFGTGYSSLSYLSAFPLDVLKIDKSFVDQLLVSEEGEAMVRAVVDLASSLGLETVAEGVEHHEQAAVLERIGCSLAQGFVFARPEAADETARMLSVARGFALR